MITKISDEDKVLTSSARTVYRELAKAEIGEPMTAERVEWFIKSYFRPPLSDYQKNFTIKRVLELYEEFIKAKQSPRPAVVVIQKDRTWDKNGPWFDFPGGKKD